MPQSSHVLKAFHQAAKERGCITAFDEGDIPHARIAQHRGKSIQFLWDTFQLVAEFGPIKLELLARLRFIAAHRMMSLCWGSQVMDKRSVTCRFPCSPLSVSEGAWSHN